MSNTEFELAAHWISSMVTICAPFLIPSFPATGPSFGPETLLRPELKPARMMQTLLMIISVRFIALITTPITALVLSSLPDSVFANFLLDYFIGGICWMLMHFFICLGQAHFSHANLLVNTHFLRVAIYESEANQLVNYFFSFGVP